jgi:hypothetical protein
MLATHVRLPQYQLKEIERQHGVDVANEARDTAIREELTAKELADRYGVAYMRGKAKPGEVAVERLHLEDIDRGYGGRSVGVVPDPVARVKSQLTQMGKKAYEEKVEEVNERLSGLKKRLEDQTEVLASAADVSGAAYGERKKYVEKLKEDVRENENELLRMKREVSGGSGGYANFVPEPVRQRMVSEAELEAVRLQMAKKPLERRGIGQLKFGEAGLEPLERERQRKVVEYRARKNMIIATQGIPASGKTTWANEYAKSHKNVVVIERSKGGGRIQAVKRALRDGKTVISADMNLRKENIDELKDVGRKFGAEVVVKRFTVSESEALRRNKNRGKPVADYIIRMYARGYDGSKKGAYS